MTPELEYLFETVTNVATDLWKKGWAERNAGNMSVRLRPVEQVRRPDTGPWRPIGVRIPEAGGERFLFTGTGSYMRNVVLSPRQGLGVIEIDAAGDSYRVLWGFTGGGDPTSELMPHLMAHAARIRVTAGADRAIIHTHPTNLIALTYAMSLDTTSLTRLLWEMHTECIVVFPMGCGFVDWRLPGSEDLAQATASVLETRTMALWQHHGIVAAGPDLDTAFGLIDTAEKAAQIYLLAAPLGDVPHRLTTAQLTALAEKFGVDPDPAILVEGRGPRGRAGALARPRPG